MDLKAAAEDEMAARVRGTARAIARSHLAASVETVACVWALAWFGCLLVNEVLLTYPMYSVMTRHAPQLAWATFAGITAAVETAGLLGRELGQPWNRGVRQVGCALLVVFFACLTGELLLEDPGLPQAYGYLALSAWSLMAFARLELLRAAASDSTEGGT